MIFGEIVRSVQRTTLLAGRYRWSIVPLSFRKPPSPIDRRPGPSVGPRREVRNLVCEVCAGCVLGSRLCSWELELSRAKGEIVCCVRLCVRVG